MAREPTPDSIEAIGRRLRMIRLAYSSLQGRPDMAQIEFCRRAKIGAQAWNNCETGRNRIGLDAAKRVRALTGASLDYIYLGEKSLLPLALAREIERLESPVAAKQA